ncbi:hypothetical protein [Flavobacterium sp.]
MKKLLLAAVIVLSTFTARAQEKKSEGLEGSWFVTSQFGYQDLTLKLANLEQRHPGTNQNQH